MTRNEKENDAKMKRKRIYERERVEIMNMIRLIPFCSFLGLNDDVPKKKTNNNTFMGETVKITLICADIAERTNLMSNRTHVSIAFPAKTTKLN